MIGLLLFAFGALTFTVLTLYYWRQGDSRRDPVFAAFTAVCAAAFLINILSRIEALWGLPLVAVAGLATGLIAPLLLHLVVRDRVPALRIAFYAAGVTAAVAFALDDLSLVTIPFRDQAPAVMLATAGALGLIFPKRDNRRLLLWYRALLALLVAATVAGLFVRSALTVLAPDYLLLSIFCVTLYYRERLIFFDVLIKRGIFFGCCLAAVVLVLSVVGVSDRLTLLLVLTALLLLAPWADRTLARWTDRTFLRRRYSPEEAERLFTQDLQLAATEDDLRLRAERCLSEIFHCGSEVSFAPHSRQEAAGELFTDLGYGYMVLKPRPSGIPHMTADRRLFDTLALTLRVVLENVRFRQEQQSQREREQQLRLLASRAELKALRAQIDPHFLFNTLNAIAGFIPSQPDEADLAIERLAQVFRYTLRKSGTEWARLDEEADFAAAYLQLEQARFGDRLQVDLAVDPDSNTVLVPAMCIQPLIENAIRHGTSTVEGKGVLGLHIRVTASAATIEVSDNGPGFPPDFDLAGSAGYGLRNIAERLKGYYGDSAQLSWERVSNSTRVLLRVPRT